MSATIPHGLSLFDAARKMGIAFTEETPPVDKFIQVNGLRLHYLDWGNPHLKPMLLLHGGAQTAHSWDFFALALRDRYHILALDQRGHGDSDWHDGGAYSWDDHLKDIEEFTRQLNLRNITQMGLSMGGRNSFAFAATHPEMVDALVIVDVGPETNPRGVKHIMDFTTGAAEFDSFEVMVQRAYRYDPRRPIEQFAGSVRHNAKQMPNGKWTWKYDRRFRAGMAKTQSKEEVIAKGWGYIGRITCPTLVVRGEESDVFPLDVAQRMVSAMPKARLASIPKAGHLVPGDNPIAFEQAVRSFLDSL